MSKTNEMTDTEYVEVLNKIKNIVDKSDFYPRAYDSVTIGDKYTTSNCGFCSKEVVTKKRKENHQCPFDMGKETMPKGNHFIDYATGCFYRCYLFHLRLHNKNDGLTNIERIRLLVRDRLKEKVVE